MLGPPRPWLLRAVQAWDRTRLHLLCARHPGLEVHPSASASFSTARYVLAPGSHLRIGARAVTERLPGRLQFHLYPGARVEVGEGTWLRTEVGDLHVVAFDGATLRIGPDCLVNGAHLSAKGEVSIGRRVQIGVGTRVFDADQHDLDAEHPERVEPVRIGDYAWIASDATVLRGVTIGEHAVVGTRSVVTRDVPPHTLVVGVPAAPLGKVGDRSATR
ncbi:MAG: acyltransferase [Myxococcota bacterium]|nr:acyltransferase [Myxococcota bacterium]